VFKRENAKDNISELEKGERKIVYAAPLLCRCKKIGHSQVITKRRVPFMFLGDTLITLASSSCRTKLQYTTW